MGYADTVMQLSPTGYWRLGESPFSAAFEDSSGNGHDATTAGVGTDFSPGVAGLLPGDPDPGFQVTAAGALSGSLSAPAGSWQHNTTFSVSCLVKKSVTPSSDYDCIASTRDHGNEQQWSIYVPSNAAQPGNAGKVQILGVTGTGSTSDFTLVTTGSVCDGNVHHIVLTITPAGPWKLYRDGVLEGSITPASSFYAGAGSTSPLYIGCEGAARGLNGVVDEFATWFGTALTQADVSRLYDGYRRSGVHLGMGGYGG